MRYCFSIFFCFIFLFFSPVLAQQSPDTILQVHESDTLKGQLQNPDRLQADPFAGMDSVSNRLVQGLEELTSDLNKVNGVLRRGLDTIEIHDELPEVLNLLERVKGSLYAAEGTPNLRILNAVKVVLVQNNAKLSDWQKILERYNSTLQGLRKEILEGLDVQEFNNAAVLHLYSVQMGELEKKWRTVKAEFEVQNNNIALLLQRVAGASILARDLTDEVNFRIRKVKRGMLHKTDPFIWEPFPDQQGNLFTMFARSTKFSWRIFVYYVADRWGFILILLMIAAGFYALIRKRLTYLWDKRQELLLEPVKYLSRNSALCAALLAFTIIPFLSFSPPAVYIELSWFTMLLVATRLAWVDWSAEYHKYWRGIVVLFFLFGFDNIITGITAGERWSILLLSGAAIYLGVKLIREVRREPARYPVFQKEVVWLFIVANAVSFFLNIFGRFTLAKVISNSAVIGLAHALSFFLLVEILVEALYLALEGNDSNKLSSYFQFSALKPKFRKVLVFLGIFLWLLAFLWSLNLLDSAGEAVSAMLQKDRMIGTMEFTFGSIAIFILIFW